MKITLKTIAYISIFPLLIGLYFFDNIRGYYRFKELCAAHKELVVYHKLEPNVGWQIDLNKPYGKDIIEEYLYFMPQIKFFRFKDYRGRQIYDGRFVGNNRISWDKFDHLVRSTLDDAQEDPKNYEFLAADLDSKPVYQLENFSENIPHETRLARSGYRIRDLRTNQLMVVVERFGYGLFDQDKTILAAPSGHNCRIAPSILSIEVNRQIFAK